MQLFWKLDTCIECMSFDFHFETSHGSAVISEVKAAEETITREGSSNEKKKKIVNGTYVFCQTAESIKAQTYLGDTCLSRV